jgi:SET domain-containing protein
MAMQINDDLIVVRDSELHGKGLFTLTEIQQGTVIMKIIGEEIDEDECIKREIEGNNVYIFYKDENKYVDTINTKKIKYINHNCDCNCYVDEDQQGNLILVAKSDIKTDEELTIDYGYDEIYIECNCENCENKL